jgi:hypothetical protein
MLIRIFSVSRRAILSNGLKIWMLFLWKVEMLKNFTIIARLCKRAFRLSNFNGISQSQTGYCGKMGSKQLCLAAKRLLEKALKDSHNPRPLFDDDDGLGPGDSLGRSWHNVEGTGTRWLEMPEQRHAMFAFVASRDEEHLKYLKVPQSGIMFLVIKDPITGLGVCNEDDYDIDYDLTIWEFQSYKIWDVSRQRRETSDTWRKTHPNEPWWKGFAFRLKDDDRFTVYYMKEMPASAPKGTPRGRVGRPRSDGLDQPGQPAKKKQKACPAESICS